jgi:hypothetical protein
VLLLIACNYINTSCELFGGSFTRVLPHSLLIIIIYLFLSFVLVLGWDMGMSC